MGCDCLSRDGSGELKGLFLDHTRSLASWSEVDLSVTDLPQLQPPHTSVNFFAIFLPSFSISGAGVSACPFWGSRDLCMCRELSDPLVESQCKNKVIKA